MVLAARLRGAAAIAVAAFAVAGCGDGEGEATPGAVGGVPGGGTLSYALAGQARELDPLLATSRPELLVTRQVHEPLVASLVGPFGDVRRSRGLAIAWRPTPDRQIWSFRLRQGIRFQDGSPLNATAVLANAERWRTLDAGRELLPELVAADAPRPDLVRFFLSSAVSDFPQRLASPRLGIVSPAALRPRSGVSALLAAGRRSGTGPFEFRESTAGGPIVLAGNTEYWGTRLDLGPALNELEFEIVPSARERLDLLEAGAVQVADELGSVPIERLRANPLVTSERGPGGAVLGLERSVRGIDSATAIEPLSNVWLTVVGTE